jgi:hypothetical protein
MYCVKAIGMEGLCYVVLCCVVCVCVCVCVCERERERKRERERNELLGFFKRKKFFECLGHYQRITKNYIPIG